MKASQNYRLERLAEQLVTPARFGIQRATREQLLVMEAFKRGKDIATPTELQCKLRRGEEPTDDNRAEHLASVMFRRPHK
jgi:hypothetical protein